MSKLGKLKYKNENDSIQDVKAEDLRQMFLAMTEEVTFHRSCLSFFFLTEKVARLFPMYFMLKLAWQLMNLSLQVRVIIVKLADRLHNMRTLSHMPQHKQVISIDLNNLLLTVYHSFAISKKTNMALQSFYFEIIQKWPRSQGS